MATKVEQKHVRKFLNKKIQQLNDIVADLDSLSTEMGSDFYRVCIFGSARIRAESENYQQVKELAYELAMREVDIVTGGGPGLMEAANLGAKSASNRSRSYGLAITLPFESDANSHLDVKYQHRRFSSRLDEFMRMSHAVVVTPGGIGTLLEFFYTWQLMQVKHISERPLILLGKDFWSDFIDWLKKVPLQDHLMDQTDFNRLIMVDTVDEVIKCLDPQIKKFQAEVLKEKTAATTSEEAP